MGWKNVVKSCSAALLLLLVCVLRASAAPVTVQVDDPKYSKIIVVAGEEKILLPDGRILPFGQGILCTDDCPAEVLAPPSSNRIWLVPVVAAGIITTAILWPGNRQPRPPRIDTSQPLPPCDDIPTAPVPEPSTLALLGLAGLLTLPRIFNARKG